MEPIQEVGRCREWLWRLVYTSVWVSFVGMGWWKAACIGVGFVFFLFIPQCFVSREFPRLRKAFVIWYYMDVAGVSCLEVDTGEGYMYVRLWMENLFFELGIYNITAPWLSMCSVSKWLMHRESIFSFVFGYSSIQLEATCMVLLESNSPEAHVALVWWIHVCNELKIA